MTGSPTNLKAMNKIKLSTIKLNPDNPRNISRKKLDLLVASISEFSAMMYLRPIVVDENNIILGGNQRFLALKALKYKEVPEEWIKKANNLTEKDKKRFIIADNVNFGDWDLETLEMNFDIADLKDWGIDEVIFELEDEVDNKPDSKPKQKMENSSITCPNCGCEIDV